MDTQLNNAKIVLSSDSINLLDPGVVYWPVVPRKVATAIHRAQLEVLKVLYFLGWQVHVVIVDVCIPDEFKNNGYSESFYQNVEGYLLRRNTSIDYRVTKLSEIFNINTPKCCIAREQLEKNIARINFALLTRMNDKQYADDEIEDSKRQPISRHLRPIYTITGLSVISKNENFEKNLILSGEDESVYWEYVHDIPHNSIVIPRLNQDANVQVMQKDEYPSWRSKTSFEKDLHESRLEENSSNLTDWIKQMFVTLPSIVLDDYGEKMAEMITKYHDKQFPVREFVKHVFPLLDLRG